jgi:hypothetical protein
MTQEDKELLLKDLSARLQYNVQILADIDKTFEGGVISTLKVINLKKDWVELQSVLTPFKFDEIKPYLRPISSMTEAESEEFANMEIVGYNTYDWLNAHHFDYRGLIEKGLAIEVTEENNPYKE